MFGYLSVCPRFVVLRFTTLPHDAEAQLRLIVAFAGFISIVFYNVAAIFDWSFPFAAFALFNITYALIHRDVDVRHFYDSI